MVILKILWGTLWKINLNNLSYLVFYKQMYIIILHNFNLIFFTIILDTCIDQAKLEEYEEKASEHCKKVSNQFPLQNCGSCYWCCFFRVLGTPVTRPCSMEYYLNHFAIGSTLHVLFFHCSCVGSMSQVK